MMRSIKSRGGLTRGRGFTESTHHQQWVHTAQQCAVIHEVMTSVTKSTFANSEQHVELGVSRKNRDVSDLSKIQASENIICSKVVQSSDHYLQGFTMIVQSIVTTESWKGNSRTT